MRSTLFMTAAACAFIAGCGSPDGDASSGTVANGANQVLPITDGEANAAQATAALPSEPVAKDKAAAFMRERHEKYEAIGDAMKVVSRELKSDNPDLAAVRQRATQIEAFAQQVPSLFPPGTGPEAGKTEAKADIWRNPDDFLAKSRDFAAAAKAFRTAAQGSDLAAMRAAHGELGKTCKACHDLYRAEH